MHIAYNYVLHKCIQFWTLPMSYITCLLFMCTVLCLGQTCQGRGFVFVAPARAPALFAACAVSRRAGPSLRRAEKGVKERPN